MSKLKPDVKQKGQYFTPGFVADFMVKIITQPKTAKILEPCAGHGIFLDALLKAQFINIKAIEIDEDLKNESKHPIDYRDFLTSKFEEKFDVIIGNPPYIRWKNIPKKTQLTFQSDPAWHDKLNGLSDILYAFIFKCVELLTDDGELIFITPLFWSSTLHARFLRKFLIDNGTLEIFITFNEMRIFKDVSSNIVIFKFHKGKKKENFTKRIKIININSKKKLESTVINQIEPILASLNQNEYYRNGIFLGYLYPQFNNSNPWQPIPPWIQNEIQQIEKICKEKAPIILTLDKTIGDVKLSTLFDQSDLELLELDVNQCKKVRFLEKTYYSASELSPPLERFIRLGDIAEIGNGMVSGLDKAFQVHLDSEKYNDFEKKFFIKVVKSKDLRKFTFDKFEYYIFLNSLDEIEQNSQLKAIKQKLQPYQQELAQRYNYGKEIPCWKWVFPRNQELMEHNSIKIFVPCKERFDSKKYIRFALVKGDFYGAQDTTVIVKKPFYKESEKFFLAILNSELIFTWLLYKGLLRGGVMEFSEKPLSSIPIRLIDWQSKTDTELYDQIIKLVDLILKSGNYETYKAQLDELIKKLYAIT